MKTLYKVAGIIGCVCLALTTIGVWVGLAQGDPSTLEIVLGVLGALAIIIIACFGIYCFISQKLKFVQMFWLIMLVMSIAQLIWLILIIVFTQDCQEKNDGIHKFFCEKDKTNMLVTTIIMLVICVFLFIVAFLLWKLLKDEDKPNDN